MTRPCSNELATAIAQDVTTLCSLLTITRRDGTVLRLTTFDRDITFNGEVYSTEPSFDHTAIYTAMSAGSGQNVTITSVMVDNGFDETDVRAGLYKGAQGKIERIDYLHPEWGSMTFFEGTFGVVRIWRNSRRIEIELQPLSGANFGQVGRKRYSPTCRAVLGDDDCGVDLDTYKEAFTVDTVTTAGFTASELNQPDDFWAIGVVKWLTGENAGIVTDVQSSVHSGGSVSLVEAPPHPIQVGDTGEIYPGCTKQPTFCRDRYDNILNFRGEPFVPQSIGYTPPLITFLGDGQQ